MRGYYCAAKCNPDRGTVKRGTQESVKRLHIPPNRQLTHSFGSVYPRRSVRNPSGPAQCQETETMTVDSRSRGRPFYSTPSPIQSSGFRRAGAGGETASDPPMGFTRLKKGDTEKGDGSTKDLRLVVVSDGYLLSWEKTMTSVLSVRACGHIVQRATLTCMLLVANVSFLSRPVFRRNPRAGPRRPFPTPTVPASSQDRREGPLPVRRRACRFG